MSLTTVASWAGRQPNVRGDELPGLARSQVRAGASVGSRRPPRRPLLHRILERLPPGSKRFVEHLSQTSRGTTMQAVKPLIASWPIVLRQLHLLAATDLIEREGTSP